MSKRSVRATWRSMSAIIASRHSHALRFSSIRPPEVKCAARRMNQHWKNARSGMCSADHSTFTPPFSSILKSVRLASGSNPFPVQ